MAKKQHSKTSRNKLPRIPREFCKTDLNTPRYKTVNAQKAKQYRDELEPLVGKAEIEFKSDTWSYMPYTIHHKKYIRILMEDVQITKIPPGCGIGNMPVLDHIFIVTDRNWAKRNNPQEGDILKCKGYVHEYYAHTQHRKNIGIKATEIRIKRANSRPPHAYKNKPDPPDKDKNKGR